jgi:hypothetical protein
MHEEHLQFMGFTHRMTQLSGSMPEVVHVAVLDADAVHALRF